MSFIQSGQAMIVQLGLRHTWIHTTLGPLSSVRPKFGIGRKYRPKVSAETIGIGIGFGAETFFSETETFFFQKFSKIFNFFSCISA